MISEEQVEFSIHIDTKYMFFSYNFVNSLRKRVRCVLNHSTTSKRLISQAYKMINTLSLDASLREAPLISPSVYNCQCLQLSVYTAVSVYSGLVRNVR